MSSSDEVLAVVKKRMEELKARDEAQKVEKEKPKAPKPTVKPHLKAGGKGVLKFKDIWNVMPGSGLPNFEVRCGIKKPGDFDECVRGYIPEDEPEYVASPTETAMFTLAMNNGRNPLIYGPKGSGKSTMPKVYAARTGQPFFRVPCRRDMEASDLFGTVTVRNKEVVFNDGPITLAARYGGIVCLDEASVLQAGAALSLQYILENNGRVMLPDHPSEDPLEKMVTPHPDFRLVLTDNTALAGDHTGAYVGTNVQNEAFRDRIDVIVRLGYMPAKEEIKMINNHVSGIPKEQVKDMVSFAGIVRNAYEKGDLESATVSPRTLIRWGRDGLSFGNFDMAFRFCFMNGLSPDDETVVSGLYKKVFGTTP